MPDDADTDRSDPEAQTRRIVAAEWSSVPASVSQSGRRVGRYLLAEVIGQGGMGVVYRAHDPALDREIAIKLVRGTSDPVAQARLVLEAKAMAALSHPAVLPVYDVGTVDDEVFLAMELVHGRTLRAWTREADHDWRETVATFVAAAGGLLAAHRAGIVHRDFKPANVLLTDDGRVLVTDFGLARPDASRLVDSQDDPLSSGAWSISGDLTLPDEVMGTPAFMAPEAIAAKTASPATDQFSFCVALYEALYGMRPWTTAELMAAVRHHRALAVPPGPRNRNVPARVHAVLVRGLAWDPADRWPSLAELVAALERAGPRPRLVPIAAAGTLIAALVVVASMGGGEGCDDGRDRLAGVWDPARRDAVDAALRERAGSSGADAVVQVVSALDARASEWVRVYEASCAAVVAGGEPWHGDPQADCLAEQRVRLRTTADVLAEPDSHTAHLALAAVHALPSASECESASPRPVGHAGRHLALRERIAEASALLSAGRIDQAIAVARGLAAEAADVGDRALEAEVHGLLGDALIEAEVDVAAAEALERAYFLAQEDGADLIARDAATSLAFVVGVRMSRPDDGRRWLDHAQAVASRLPAEPLAEAERDTIEGAIAQREGRAEDAIEVLQRALTTRRATLGDRDTRVAVTLLNLGNAYGEAGRGREAREATTAALEIWTEIYGPEHPDVAHAITNLGVIAYDEGQFDQAIAHYTRALELCGAIFEDELPCVHTMIDLGNAMWRVGRLDEALDWNERALALVESSFGADHPTAALAQANRANVLAERGDLPRAIEGWLRARTAFERSLGAEHPRVAVVLANLATGRASLGDHVHALQDFERAHAILVAAHGPRHPHVASVEFDIATLHAELGDLAAAEAHHRSALRIREALLPVEHPEVAASLLGLGTVLIDRGRPEEAAVLLERAGPILAKTEIDGDDRTKVRAELARARAAMR